MDSYYDGIAETYVYYVDGGNALESVKDLLRNLRMGYDIGSTEEILERLKKELQA